jgi:hypothetical protein
MCWNTPELMAADPGSLTKTPDGTIAAPAARAMPSWAGPAVCGVGALVVVVVAIATHAHTFTEADSINLARGFQHYTVATDSPHPPGYPLVVLAAHLVGWTGSSLTAYLTVAALAAVATVVATYFLGREMFGETAGIVAVLVVVATPLFLYYVDIVSVYLTESAMATVVALLAHRTARQAGPLSPLLLFPVLAIGGGFRPTMMFLMLPACVVGIVFGRPAVRSIVIGLVIGLGIVAAWGIPMVSKSGGWHAYWQASQTLYRGQAKLTSLLYGASVHQAVFNVEVALAATVMILVPGMFVVLLAFRRRKDGGSSGDTAAVTSNGARRWVRSPALWILAAWFVPYAVIYFAVQLGKPGYALVFLPIAAVAAGGLVASSPRALPVAGVLALVLLVAFLVLPQWSFPWRLDVFFPTAHAVRVQDQEAQGLVAVGRTCPRATCTVVSLDSSDRYWYHDAASLARWYSGGARIVTLSQAENGGPPAPNSTVYWVGSLVPTAVANLARPDATYGSWSVFRSSAHSTDEILQMIR